MRSVNKKIITTTILALFLLSALSSAAIVNAKPQKINVYPGQSIQAAIDVAQSGATIVVHAGTYFERVIVEKPLTLTSEGATLDLTGVSFPPFTLPEVRGNAAIYVDTAGVSISGFTIQNIPPNINPNGLPGDLPFSCAIRFFGSYCGATVENNVIYSDYWGIMIGGNFLTSGISNAIVRNNTITATAGIFGFNAPNILIRDNTITALTNPTRPGWHPMGIYTNGDFIYDGGTIKNNQISSQYWGFRIGPDPSHLYPIKDLQIENNQVTSSVISLLVNNQTGIEVKDNVFNANTQVINITGPDATVSNNLITTNGGAINLAKAEDATVKNNEITAVGFGISISAGFLVNGPEQAISNIEVVGNVIHQSAFGIVPIKVANSVFKDNQVNANGLMGIGLSGYGNKISGNTVTGNCIQGINIRGLPFGSALVDSTGNTISDNTISIGTAAKDIGVYLYPSAPSNTINANTISGATSGILAEGAGDYTVKNNIISASSVGINMTGPDCTVKGNVVNSAGIGIVISNASNADIKNNEVTAVGSGIMVFAGLNLAGMDQPIRNVEISNNVVHNSGAGLMLVKLADSKIKNNEVTATGMGIALSGIDNIISCNTVNGNFLLGINIRGMPFGNINNLVDSTGNTIRSNSITGGTTAGDMGVYLFPTASSNTVTRNSISDVDFLIVDDGTGNVIIP